MATLEYIYHSTESENYKKILTLREKDSKDEKASHLRLFRHILFQFHRVILCHFQ